MLIQIWLSIALGSAAADGWLTQDAIQRLLSAFPKYFTEKDLGDDTAARGAFWCVRADFNGDGERDVAVLGRDEAQREFIVVVLYRERRGWRPSVVDRWTAPRQVIGIELLRAGWPEEAPLIAGRLPGLLIMARDADGSDTGTWAYRSTAGGWRGTRLKDTNR